MSYHVQFIALCVATVGLAGLMVTALVMLITIVRRYR